MEINTKKLLGIEELILDTIHDGEEERVEEMLSRVQNLLNMRKKCWVAEE